MGAENSSHLPQSVDPPLNKIGKALRICKFLLENQITFFKIHFIDPKRGLFPTFCSKAFFSLLTESSGVLIQLLNLTTVLLVVVSLTEPDIQREDDHQP